MNIYILYLVIIIIVAIIIHSYIKYEEEDAKYIESEDISDVMNNNITENFQGNSDNVTIKMSRGELQSQADVLKKQINQISDIINKINNENSKERLTYENINRIDNVYKNVKKHIKIDNLLNKENILFRNEQYFQDKEIDKQIQELAELKTQLELITNKEPKTTIKSIKNPISGINLNIHNVNPIYDKQYTSVDDIGFGQTRTMDECILKCKNKDDCVGVTYDTDLNLCKGTTKVNPNFSSDERTYSNMKSWVKDNSALIYLNGKCLSYYQDVLLVKKNSAINNWFDCDNLIIGMINYVNKSLDGKQQLLDSLVGDDIKMVKPTYTYFNYKKGNDTITQNHNEQSINEIISKLNNDNINGLRMPLNTNIRNIIINKLKQQPGGLINNYRFVDINSGYDLNICSTKNDTQIFNVTKVSELDEYNNMVRGENKAHKGHGYKSLYKQYEIDVNNGPNKAKHCSEKCEGIHRLTCKTTNYDINPDIANTEPCIANPEINYTLSTPSVESCKKACNDDPDCLGITYINNPGDEKCIGNRFKGGIVKSVGEGSDNKFGWNKHTKYELKTLDYTPTPFHIVTNKNNLTNGKRECLTVNGDDVSIRPCDLGLGQRWNISKKHINC